MGNFDTRRLIMVMVLNQLMYAATTLFTRAALLRGLNSMVFVVYRQGVAFLIMAPLAFLSSRRNPGRSVLSLRSLGWIFLASLFGVTGNQITFFEGLDLASAGAASAMIVIIPAITFAMAAIFRMETVNIRSVRSLAKILGTIICVGGAIVMALLRGPKLLNNTEYLSPKYLLKLVLVGDTWLIGCLLLFASSCFWSLWTILQVPVTANCPNHLLSSTLTGVMAVAESTVIVLCVERDLSIFKLDSLLQVACCFCGGIGLAVNVLVQAWCISKRGPLFAALFNPISTIMTIVFGALFLHEVTYTGSLIGAGAVIIGLYVVLWGKAEDQKDNKKDMLPRLQNESLGKASRRKHELEEQLLLDNNENISIAVNSESDIIACN